MGGEEGDHTMTRSFFRNSWNSAVSISGREDGGGSLEFVDENAEVP